jgi:hypothetical protein
MLRNAGALLPRCVPSTAVWPETISIRDRSHLKLSFVEVTFPGETDLDGQLLAMTIGIRSHLETPAKALKIIDANMKACHPSATGRWEKRAGIRKPSNRFLGEDISWRPVAQSHAPGECAENCALQFPATGRDSRLMPEIGSQAHATAGWVLRISNYFFSFCDELLIADDKDRGSLRAPARTRDERSLQWGTLAITCRTQRGLRSMNCTSTLQPISIYAV